jgi:hypothetical protein
MLQADLIEVYALFISVHPSDIAHCIAANAPPA